MTRTRLVLVHGTRVSRTQWDLPAYRDLWRGLRRRLPDLPGHGPARRGAVHHRRRRRGDRRRRWSPATVLRPVVLVGHSLGGYMAMAYAARHPEPARRPGAHRRQRGAPGTRRRGIPGLCLAPATAGPRTDGPPVQPRAGPAGGAGDRCRRCSRAAPPTTRPPTPGPAVMADCRPDLLRGWPARCSCSTASSTSSASTPGASPRTAASAHVVVVPRASHLLPITHPALVRRADAATSPRGRRDERIPGRARRPERMTAP